MRDELNWANYQQNELIFLLVANPLFLTTKHFGKLSGAFRGVYNYFNCNVIKSRSGVFDTGILWRPHSSLSQPSGLPK